MNNLIQKLILKNPFKYMYITVISAKTLLWIIELEVVWIRKRVRGASEKFSA
jgi:hypothetical protein